MADQGRRDLLQTREISGGGEDVEDEHETILLPPLTSIHGRP
jgi:hypothetical protein